MLGREVNYWQNSDFFFLRKVHQKMAEHLSHLSPRQYELCLEILFIVFVLGENREPVTLSPKKSNRFSSLSLDMTFDTWKHHWGACFYLSSISYLLSLPVSHWKVFCVCVLWRDFFIPVHGMRCLYHLHSWQEWGSLRAQGHVAWGSQLCTALICSYWVLNLF